MSSPRLVYHLSPELAEVVGKTVASEAECAELLNSRFVFRAFISSEQTGRTLVPTRSSAIAKRIDAFLIQNGLEEYSSGVIRAFLRKHLSFPCCLANREPLDKGLKTLIDSKALCDVNLVCADDISLPTYKFLLAARSDVFLAMFQQKGFVEATQNEVKIDDVSSDVMQLFLEFLVRDDIDLERFQQFSKQLFRVGDKYLVQDLKGVCEEMIAADRNVENCAANIEFGVRHNNRRIMEAAYHVLRSQKEAVLASEGWKHLELNNSGLVLEFLVEML